MNNTTSSRGSIAVGMAALVVLAAAPAANADPADDNFLRALNQRGLTWPSGNDQTMINVGHAVCADWAGGDTMA